MKPVPCPLCGANLNVVGTRHRCVPRQIAPAPVTHPVDNGAGKGTRVDNGNDKPRVINIATSANAQTNAQRQAKWRSANRDKHRERNRDLMRQRRADGRAA